MPPSAWPGGSPDAPWCPSPRITPGAQRSSIAIRTSEGFPPRDLFRRRGRCTRRTRSGSPVLYAVNGQLHNGDGRQKQSVGVFPVGAAAGCRRGTTRRTECRSEPKGTRSNRLAGAISAIAKADSHRKAVRRCAGRDAHPDGWRPASAHHSAATGLRHRISPVDGAGHRAARIDRSAWRAWSRHRVRQRHSGAGHARARRSQNDCLRRRPRCLPPAS